MSVSAWPRWLRRPSSPPDPFRDTDGRTPSRRRSPASDSSDTPPRPLGRAGAALRALLLAPLLALPFLAPAPDAAAQTVETLASNIGQASDSTGGLSVDYAQAFTTGSNADGYSLRSVDVHFSQLAASVNLSVSIRSNSGGQPGTTLGTLTVPALSASPTGATVTFTTTGIPLAASTTYFLVLDSATLTSGWQVYLGGRGLDSGALPDWSFGEAASRLAITNGNFAGAGGNSLRFRLKGVVEGDPVAKVTNANTANAVDGKCHIREGQRALFSIELDRAATALTGVNYRLDGPQGVVTGGSWQTRSGGGTELRLWHLPTSDSVHDPDGVHDYTLTVLPPRRHLGQLIAGNYSVGTPASVTIKVCDDDPAPNVTSTTPNSACQAPASGSHWNPVRGKPVTGGVGKVRKRVKATFEGKDTLTRYGVCTMARQNVTDGLFGRAGPWCGPRGHTANWEAVYAELDRLETCRNTLDTTLATPVVSVAAGPAVTEGTAASFTLTTTRAPTAPLSVSVTVAQSGDFAASGATGTRTVTIPVTGTASLSVATVDDSTAEADGSVRVTLGTGTGYWVAAAPANAATVAVSDDDRTPDMPTISIADMTVKENAGIVRYRATMSHAAGRDVILRARVRESTPRSATNRVDFVGSSSFLLHFPKSGRVGREGTALGVATETRSTTGWFYVRNDSHDEGPETFEIELYGVHPPGAAVITDAVAVVTIENADPMPAAFLSRFGRTVAQQAVDGIAGRIAAPRTPGMAGTLAGQALGGAPPDDASPGGTRANLADRHAATALADVARGFGADGFGAGGFGNDPGSGPGQALGFGEAGPHSRTMTAREALLGSSFTATGEADGAGGSLAFWGRVAQSSFDGREGTFSLDGEATTAMLGADYARGKWLLGLALAQSEGEGGYGDTDIASRPASQTCPADAEGAGAELCRAAVRAGDGKVEASLTAAIPYAALQASERLRLWGAAGYGTGEVTLKTATGGSYEADTEWSMAAAGVRSELLQPPDDGGGPALALVSDALWTRTSSEKTRDLAASEGDTTRLRLGLEGSWRVALEGGGHVTPRLEVGARQDGGDAETGFGVELGGGIAWADPALGLTLDLSGRTLIAHGDDDLEDRGYAGSLGFDPDPATKRGPSFALRQEFGGQARGGLDALFAPEPLGERTGGGTSEATSRWAMEAAYGFPAFGGRFTASPHAGLGLATGAREWTLGWRLEPDRKDAPDLALGLRATRRESDTAAPDHIFGFEATARW